MKDCNEKGRIFEIILQSAKIVTEFEGSEFMNLWIHDDSFFLHALAMGMPKPY